MLFAGLIVYHALHKETIIGRDSSAPVFQGELGKGITEILKETLENAPEPCGGMVSLTGNISHGDIEYHSCFIRHWQTGELVCVPDGMVDVAVVPGASLQTATLAHMMERYGLELEQQIPTNQGVIEGLYLPICEPGEDYEKETGRDSISVREAFLNSFSYLPYYLAKERLSSRIGYTSFIKVLLAYCGKESFQQIPEYGTDGFSSLMPYSVAFGQGLHLTHGQILRLYSLIANCGVRSGKRLMSRATADSLSMLLRQNILESDVPVSARFGYSEDCTDICAGAVPGLGTVDQDHPLKEYTFAGFYPSEEPQYAIVITLLSKGSQSQVGALAMQIVKRIANLRGNVSRTQTEVSY